MTNLDCYSARLAHALALAGGMKQTELAEAIGVKKAAVNQVLSGKSQYLNALNSARAAEILKVDHHWLATGQGQPRPTETPEPTEAVQPPMTYGSRLASALDLAAKSRGELALHLAISPQAIGQVIRNDTGALTAENSARAARFLNVDHFWLATGEGQAREALHVERLALSTEAVGVGQALDRVTPSDRRNQAIALIEQVLKLCGPAGS